MGFNGVPGGFRVFQDAPVVFLRISGVFLGFQGRSEHSSYAPWDTGRSKSVTVNLREVQKGKGRFKKF